MKSTLPLVLLATLVFTSVGGCQHDVSATKPVTQQPKKPKPQVKKSSTAPEEEVRFLEDHFFRGKESLYWGLNFSETKDHQGVFHSFVVRYHSGIDGYELTINYHRNQNGVTLDAVFHDTGPNGLLGFATITTPKETWEYNFYSKKIHKTVNGSLNGKNGQAHMTQKTADFAHKLYGEVIVLFIDWLRTKDYLPQKFDSPLENGPRIPPGATPAGLTL